MLPRQEKLTQRVAVKPTQRVAMKPTQLQIMIRTQKWQSQRKRMTIRKTAKAEMELLVEALAELMDHHSPDDDPLNNVHVEVIGCRIK